MKKPFVALLLLLGATAMWAGSAPAQTAQNGDGNKLVNGNWSRELLGSRARRLGVSSLGGPETTWVGKSYTNHTAPDNYWNIYVGDNLPGTATPTNALWDWDNTVGIQAADTLQGWWPIHRQWPGNQTGGLTLPDDQRSWWGLDHGNIGNYVISQNISAKRTFGVVSYWHRDPGKPGSGSSLGINWSPITGSNSAWCGLRIHGDNAVQDQVTKNYFNQDVVQFFPDAGSATKPPLGPGGTAQRYPGYADQSDQFLYRDIALQPNENLSVSFNYRTRMATTIGTATATRVGWFDGDPLAVINGNFISSSAAGVNAPRDSFMVYVGAPVNDLACSYSDGLPPKAVYDKQRRWFSEVIKRFGAGANYTEIFAVAGNNPRTGGHPGVATDTSLATPSSGLLTVPAATISTILGAVPGDVRLVFRVKTNRTGSDGDGSFNSFGRGAVLLDDIAIGHSSVNPTPPASTVIGDFETAEQGGVNAIDNRFPLPGGLTNHDVWRTSGKPPTEYFHIRALSELVYNDICGPPNSASRICNMSGLVLSAGNKDQGEHMTDQLVLPWKEIFDMCLSPTINLVPGPTGGPNSMGIDTTAVKISDDAYVFYDIYTGAMDLLFSGNSWVFGSMSYPAQQLNNGTKCWGQPTAIPFNIFNPDPQCLQDIEPYKANGVAFRTANNGQPDSIRIYLSHQQQCYRFAISLGCNTDQGCYFDNVSLALVNAVGGGGGLTEFTLGAVGIPGADWSLMQDAFPFNETPGLPGTANFDTAAALVRTGQNGAQTTGNKNRFDLPLDSTYVDGEDAASPNTADNTDVRMDMIFRILPGPGNYQIAGAPRQLLIGPSGEGVSGDLLQVPSNQGALAVSGDASYWGKYLADNGAFGSGGNGTTGPGHPAGKWSPIVWNSARMDTTETNIFPDDLIRNGVVGDPQWPTFIGQWCSTMHEDEPKFAALGVNKFKCFLLDTNSTTTNSTNSICDGTVPAYLTLIPQSRTGYNGSNVTKEFSKIIPDGLLTPGAHVQYFFRKSLITPHTGITFAMTPDTGLITPQADEGNNDQHRWSTYAILPDRWKASAYSGPGNACMLYIDWNDRRGNEGRFVAVMDSIGATASAKHGAHNGWFAAGTDDITDPLVVPSVSVQRNSQPGTTWDLFQVKASESLTTSTGAVGDRLANRTGLALASGKESKLGPTPEMLRAYYRIVAILTGDLDSGIMGPYTNRGSNDIAILNDFLTTAGGTSQPRGLFIQGDGLVQAEAAEASQDPSHPAFLTDKLGLSLRSPAYQSLSGNQNDCADVLATSFLTGVHAGGTDVFASSNFCFFGNDVFTRNAALPEVHEGGFYEPVGLNKPYISDMVHTNSDPNHNWVAVTSGYEIEHLLSRYCDTDNGRLAYYYYMLQTAFSATCVVDGAPLTTLDTPQSGRGYSNFMKIGNSVMRQGTSFVRFGVAKAGRVQVSIYDVTGRRIRNLADRVFSAGEHSLQWDGTDDAGNKVARGVYFVRSSVQKDAGRIIVLNN